MRLGDRIAHYATFNCYVMKNFKRMKFNLHNDTKRSGTLYTLST